MLFLQNFQAFGLADTTASNRPKGDSCQPHCLLNIPKKKAAEATYDDCTMHNRKSTKVFLNAEISIRLAQSIEKNQSKRYS